MGRRGTDRRRSCAWKGRVSRLDDIARSHLGCILLKMEAVSLLTGVTDMWCTNVTRTNISLRTLGVPSGPDDQPRGTFVRAGAVLRSEQQRHLERPALHGGSHSPHRSQRPNRPLLHVCETYPRPTFLSILPPFTFPTFRSRDVKCVREQVPGAAAEPRAAASGAALHGDVPGIAVLGPTHHERYVHLLWATLAQPLSTWLQELQGRGPGVEKSLRVCHILCQRESSFCKGRVLNVRTSVCLNFRGRGDP